MTYFQAHRSFAQKCIITNWPCDLRDKWAFVFFWSDVQLQSPVGRGPKWAFVVVFCQTFGYVHLSAGDLLRAERQKTDSEFREEIELHIKNGSIVPVEITCSLLKQVLPLLTAQLGLDPSYKAPFSNGS